MNVHTYWCEDQKQSVAISYITSNGAKGREEEASTRQDATNKGRDPPTDKRTRPIRAGVVACGLAELGKSGEEGT